MLTSIPSRKAPPARAALRPICLAALLALSATAAHAQPAQSMEERLRAQLRATTTQLQQAQNELAMLKAGQATPGAPAAAPGKPASPDADLLRKELAQSRAQLAAERQAREKQGEGTEQVQQQAQEVVEKANAQIAQYRNAYDELLKLARASEAERQRLAAETMLQKTTVAQCEAKNAQLYAVGQDVIRAYETLEVGDVMAARQPFAAQSRVRFEQIAQQYGDKLYEGRFDARSVVPKPAEAAAPAPAPAPAPATK